MKNNERSFNISPNDSLEFYIDSDMNSPIKAIGLQHGKISSIANIVNYTPQQDFNGVETFQLSFKKNKKEVKSHFSIKVGYSFKAKSHILNLLGDELIGSDNLAIFELVKNAYDADADEVKISLTNMNTREQAIVIEDDGSGMTLDILKSAWLEIGTDFKRGKKRIPSKKYGRISLGEKGVGRLAVHKLGGNVILETQAQGEKYSYRLELKWQDVIDQAEYINDTSVTIKRIDESLFSKKRGTRIIISDLKKKEWDKKDFKDLARKINSIISPFKKVKGAFDVKIESDKIYQDWIDEVKNVDSILSDSIYYFDFKLMPNGSSKFANFSWSYKFNPPTSFNLNPEHKIHPDKSKSKSPGSRNYNILRIKSDSNIYQKEQKHLTNDDLDGIGEITGRFHIFNLLSVVLNAFGQSKAIKNYVGDNSGIKVFRDGIRVYNYGEPNDDWLGLNLLRLNQPGLHFSKNVTIGAIEITQKGSHRSLKEKTNREGFDENESFLKFRDICLQIFNFFESLAQNHRDLITDYLEGQKPQKKIGLPETMLEINKKIEKSNLKKEISPLLKRVEKDYNDMRDVMLNSGMTGINLGIVFHEVDREVHYINKDLNGKVDIRNVKERVKNLIRLLENFSPILKQNQTISISAKELIDRAKQINGPRFIYHKIILSSTLSDDERGNFKISGPGNLLISAISNLLDNSIYWVSDKKELEDVNYKPAIFIGTDLKSFSGPAIIIADNGGGFKLEPEDLVLPYRTTRPGGMGLGLYFVNLVMETLGGKVSFPEVGDLSIPRGYKGAIIALVFPKIK